MFLRLNRVTQNGRTYQYAHLVESYRRPEDGRPVHRVIKALGKLSPDDIVSWQTLLGALERGQRVVVEPQPLAPTRPLSPEANLRYLDAAVLLELFRDWGLEDLCNTLLGSGQAEAPAGAIVAALTVQRCVEPGSKLFASRWIPRTALPELLGVAPSAFNNTRVHRVLDGLCETEEALQTVLARRYQERDGAFISLFLDTTETTFEGVGPALAERCRTKDGQVRRRICVPLLCNSRGYPLRWDVLPGKSADCNVFVDACQELSEVSWARGVPLVIDRAAGTTAIISQLLHTGLHIVTALVASEKPAYAPGLPCDALEDLSVEEPEVACAQAAQRIQNRGLSRVADDLYVCDLGIVERTAVKRSRERSEAPPDSRDMAARGRQALEIAQEITDAVHQGTHRSLAAAARERGLAKSVVAKYRGLLALGPGIQTAILQGQVAVPLDKLLRLAKLPIDQQETSFAVMNRRQEATPAAPSDPRPLRVRAVAYFNPMIFVEKRTHAQRSIDCVRADIEALNRRLNRSPARWTQDQAAAAADRTLRRAQLLDAFSVRVSATTDGDCTRLRVEATLDEAEWARRRRYDGFTVLVAHPGITLAAADLCALYRQREMVEQDFRVIKSLVEIHPVRHRLDHKVKAHVTLCMLALLLERTLRDKLQDHGTSELALEELATCHLNYYGKNGYALTRPSDEQHRLLHALQLQHLVEDTEVAGRITPR